MRITIPTPDDDFLDIDTVISGRNRASALIVIHGLEGSSESVYMKGLIAEVKADYDCFAMNLRSCSGRMNRQVQTYHSGKTDDLETLFQYLIKRGYTSIAVAGFSLGGNLSLLWAAHEGQQHSELSAVIGVSAPVNLVSSIRVLHERKNYIYLKRFMLRLKRKLQLKAPQLEAAGFHVDLKGIQSFYDFDNAYTAPAHGFKDAFDYYHTCSSDQFLKDIRVPTLILNALDDTFLGKACYPVVTCKQHPDVYLFSPRHGGHVGFAAPFRLAQQHWHEKVIHNFLAGKINGA